MGYVLYTTLTVLYTAAFGMLTLDPNTAELLVFYKIVLLVVDNFVCFFLYSKPHMKCTDYQQQFCSYISLYSAELRIPPSQSGRNEIHPLLD